MPFNIEADPTFQRTVKVTIPAGAEEDFLATFRALPISEFNAFDFHDADQTKAFLTKAVVRCDDIVGNDGHPVAWTPDLAAQLYDLPWARQALFTAYLEGVGNATRKN
jgi:hypothetical protein